VNLGETIFGVTVWAVLPGRTPGQRDGLAHLTWKGPGHPIHLHADGVSDGRMEHYGPGTGTVSGPCHTEADAQQAADAYLAGPALELTAASTHGPATAGSRDSSQPRTAAEASGAAGVPAADYPEDETARVLTERGTPEQQLEYALMQFSRWRRDANEAAGQQLDDAGSTAAARQRHDVAHAAANGRWAAETAAAVWWYALVIGAAPPASSGPGDVTLPYTHGWNRGSRMLAAGFPHRPADYDDSRWREYVAGYADGARFHARETIKYAEAVREQAQRNPPEAVPGAASSAAHHVAAADAPGAPEPDGSAAPGLVARKDFTGPIGAPLAARPGRRPAGTSRSPTTQPDPRGLG
jgi:hypothetical protein